MNNEYIIKKLNKHGYNAKKEGEYWTLYNELNVIIGRDKSLTSLYDIVNKVLKLLKK